ncbi:helix-turn-helix transcriptional regulator [Streptomyces sp. SUK 48]|uniref:helix-turn-helix transcriptional regulator n=1 Tax=Streptomyces sp. SUK 48 TaxID=2582831 RepID=UPI00129A74AB|nr:helix-turn-helix transcriptional regulator [Streptomyces sp. SUK 48]
MRRRPSTLNHEPAAVAWAREKYGLTKRVLAQAVGISEQLMNKIESGCRNTASTNLRKIADTLKCPVVVLERKRRPTVSS